MSAVREIVAFIGTLAVTIVVVTAATMGIVALVVPSSVTVGKVASPEPSLDAAQPPSSVGGRLVIVGDRTGSFELDTASGIGGRYRVDGGVISIGPASDPVLAGPDARIALDRDTAEIALIEFDDFSIYLDPGECTVTEGAINEEAGLMVALVDCPDVADVRGRGVVSVSGILALPIETIRGRAGLPPSGGTVVLDMGGVDDGHETSVTFDTVELFVDDVRNDDGRITSGSFSAQGGVAVEFDPEAGVFYLTQISASDYFAIAAEPCPLATTDLGAFSATTRVFEIEINCGGMTDNAGELVTVTGTVVADVIQLVLEDDGR